MIEEMRTSQDHLGMPHYRRVLQSNVINIPQLFFGESARGKWAATRQWRVYQPRTHQPKRASV